MALNLACKLKFMEMLLCHRDVTFENLFKRWYMLHRRRVFNQKLIGSTRINRKGKISFYFYFFSFEEESHLYKKKKKNWYLRKVWLPMWFKIKASVHRINKKLRHIICFIWVLGSVIGKSFLSSYGSSVMGCIWPKHCVYLCTC